MGDFFYYFFGQGTSVEFSLFTFAHAAPILVMLAIIWAIYRFRDSLRSCPFEMNIRYILAFALIITDMAYYWRLVGLPDLLQPSALYDLPIGVCGWAAIFCSYMVIGKSQRLFDISYFWLMACSIFALLTPTPLTYCGPTRFRYYQFWLAHTLGYVAIFYMVFVHGMRINRRSFLRSYLALVAMVVFAYWVNNMLPGANYLYMARPEAAPSILDILPPNFVLRVAIMWAAITAMYILAYLPWYRLEKRRKI